MIPAEVIVLCFVYVATLILGQRVAAFLVPDAQEVGFALAAIVGTLVASVLYYQRERRKAPWVVVFGAGAYMAVLAFVVGMVTQLIWQPFVFPYVSVPIAAVVTLLLPFAFFPVGRRLSGESAEIGDGAGGQHVLVAVTMLALVCLGAWQFPAPGRSILRLSTHSYPGVSVDLPDWEVAEKKTSANSGTIKLADPIGGDHFISVGWTDSDPVQPDKYINALTSGGTLAKQEQSSVTVSGHDAVTFYLESPESSSVRAIATIWNCPQDHRVMWIFNTMSGPKASMLASHQKIVESVRCHTGGEKTASGGAEKVFPGFTAPPGFVRQATGAALLYIGPKGQTIRFDPAVAGRSDVVSPDLTSEQAASVLTRTGLLRKVDGKPQLTKVTDLAGHERMVWTAQGEGTDGASIQVEVMLWWCDVRDMSFVGTYATEGKHDPREGVNTLLPAVCH